MDSGGNARILYWRRFIVDVLTGAATLAVVFAAMGTVADVLSLLLIASALLCIGLLLEPKVTAQPAGDIGSQPLQLPAELKPARPGPQPMGRFDAAIVDAMSV